jgi:tRNA 2-thiouridine synthesizing protein E
VSFIPEIEIEGIKYEVDGKGFLQTPERWNEGIARAFAAMEGVTELTEDHWKAINYLRSYYVQNGICPMIRRLVKETGLSLKQLWTLFPNGPADSACKWAGVAKPTGCV